MAYILVYGGSFDPVHNGHLITCRRARELTAADRVLLVPAAVSPHKLAERHGASAQDRLAMLQLAVKGDISFAIDDREIRRGGASYTFDTVVALQEERPADRLTLLIGADQLPKLHTWHRVGELLSRVGVGVLGRPGADLSGGFDAVRKHLGDAMADKIAAGVLDTPLVDVSSTEIRRRARAGESIVELVPAGVAEYIREHRLYQGR